MYRIGQEEIDAAAEVIRSKKLFRYDPDSQCVRFEKRYGEYLGVEHVRLTSSGTTAITAALAGLGIGPGDEVLVPAQTYMATAVSVLAVGAIPVIVDVDGSTTMAPDALAEAIGPRTKAAIPVHIWGVSCNMNAIMDIARKRKILIVEDACQAVGGGYEGKMLGSIGDAGCFSFNRYKNMTCGEGGAIVCKDAGVMQRATCTVDCCMFYWKGRDEDFHGFAASGARASEIEGAILNAQLDRLPEMMNLCRAQKKRILRETADTGLTPSITYSPDYECGGSVLYLLPTTEAADAFAAASGGVVCAKTGRHTYTEWDFVLEHRVGHVPAMNPYLFEKNRGCRMTYSKDMLPKSLDLLNRTVKIATHPDKTDAEVVATIAKIKAAASTVMAGV